MVISDTLKMEDFVGKRKHSSQLTDIEKRSLFDRVRSVEENGLKWRMTGHTLERLEQKGIHAEYNDIISTAWYSDIVEYKIDRNPIGNHVEERLVLSSKSLVNRHYRLKVVFSLTDRRIVTVWVNHIKDFHDTLDWSLYTADMPVFGI